MKQNIFMILLVVLACGCTKDEISVAVVEGIVTNSIDGSPIQGAKIVLSTHEEGRFGGGPGFGNSGGSLTYSTVATSAQDGTFSFKFDKETIYHYSIHAIHKDYDYDDNNQLSWFLNIKDETTKVNLKKVPNANVKIILSNVSEADQMNLSVNPDYHKTLIGAANNLQVGPLLKHAGNNTFKLEIIKGNNLILRDTTINLKQFKTTTVVLNY